ncbi:reverse transcriptase family protein [Trichinella spiralis]|uniref:reverse transcriptase family protein n=1 Tax=Trichinella spiralis TaxID=6334 RepID=UPI0001EFECC0|nr:reverse transcriptase family protein [Trichinella spiralis]
MRERANFFRITQSDHQTPKQFANSLREAADHCNFETFNTEAALVYVTAVKKQDILQGNASSKAQSASSVGSKAIWQKCNSWKDHKLYADGIYAVKERAHNFEVTVKINGKSTRMELDTGAAVTIVTPECWKSIGSPKPKRATVMLRSFTGHEVKLKGETMVTVEGDIGTRKLLLRVAKNGATNVMGQDWINAFGAAEALRSLLANKKEMKLSRCSKMHVELKNGVVPVFRKPFPLAFAMQDAVGKELQRYVGMGVLTPIDRSAWAAPIVTVKKPNGKIRICADFSTGLNDRLMVDSYPIPRPEDLYQALRGGKTFTKLDLSEAYLQVELDEESKKILVINTHKGLYYYNRLPFGVASAPAIFQQVMDTMLAGIPNVAAYLDDIILTGATDDEYRRTLKLVLGRLKEFGLRIRKEKCTFFQREVEYLGHILSSKGIRADPKKTAAFVNMPLPTNIAKLRSFLEWPIVLAADASNEGIGAVVYHRLSDGTVKVIAHASKTLNAAQRNYGQITKEVLALVYGVKKFHKYLWGQRFTLLTDHKPLVSIFGSKKGAELPVTARVIAEATEKGSVLKQVKQFVLSGWPEKCPREELRSYFIKRTELSVSYGCLLWGIRTVIPMKLRSRVLMKLHEIHPGRERMPAMNKDIEMKAQSCEGCATAQKNPAKMAVKPWEVADRP